MSNEELAIAYRAGDRDALLALWEQVRRLVLKQAHRWEGVGRLELEDLLQIGFIATMEAAGTYDSDGGAAFSTWLVMHIRREFTAAAGQRTERQRREPLLNALSIDAPLTDDTGDPFTLADILEDPTAAATLEAVDEKDRADRLHAALMEAINKLSPAQQEAVIGRYWKGEKVRNIHHEHALKRLRHPMFSKKLMAYR